VDPRAIVQLEVLGQLKNPIASGIKPQLVAQCLDQLRYRAPLHYIIIIIIIIIIIKCRSYLWGQLTAVHTSAGCYYLGSILLNSSPKSPLKNPCGLKAHNSPMTSP
jgi:hypothetical protein